MKKILVSGGFDPLHIGHLRLIDAASFYGDVYVALNSDAWLLRKKGYVFMPWQERAEILGALANVEAVFSVGDADGTVAEVIRKLRPSAFANGGDQTTPNPIEAAACSEVGCQMLFGIGGKKIQSSSKLARR